MNRRYLVYLLMILFGCSLLITAYQIKLMSGSKSEVATFLRKADQNLRSAFQSKNTNDPYDWKIAFAKLKFGNINDYHIKKQIGKGAFAEVYKGIHIPTGDKVAIKFLVKGISTRSMSEIRVLSDLKDAPNILKLRDVIKPDEDNGKGNVTLVFDYMKPSSPEILFAKLTPFRIKRYVYEILRTLEFAHAKNIMHRDIKPLNVMMHPKTLDVRVIDWNHAEYIEEGKNYSVRIASLHYKAPELLINNTYYGKSVDIWATGIVLAEMIFNKYHIFVSERPKHDSEHPTKAKWRSFRDQLDSIAQVLGSKELFEYINSLKDPMFQENSRDVDKHPKKSWSELIDTENMDLADPLAIDLLEKMLVYDHRKRISATEALKHSYFDDVKNWKPGMEVPESSDKPDVDFDDDDDDTDTDTIVG